MDILEIFVDLPEKLLDLLPHNYIKNINSNLGNVIKIVSEEMQEANSARKEIYNNLDIDTATGEFLNRIGRNLGQRRAGLNDKIYRLLIKAKIQQNLSPADTNSLIEYISILLQIDREDVEIHEPFWGSFSFSDTTDESEYNSEFGFSSTISEAFMDVIDSAAKVETDRELSTYQSFSKNEPFSEFIFYFFGDIRGERYEYYSAENGGMLAEHDYEPAFYSFSVPGAAVNNLQISIQNFVSIVKSLSAAGVRVTFYDEGSFSFSDTADESEYNSEFGFGSGRFGSFYESEDIYVPLN